MNEPNPDFRYFFTMRRIPASALRAIINAGEPSLTNLSPELIVYRALVSGALNSALVGSPNFAMNVPNAEARSAAITAAAAALQADGFTVTVNAPVSNVALVQIGIP